MEKDRCLKCKNYLSDLKCMAFDKIPETILLDENDHSEPLPDQGNEIVYESIDEI